MRVLIVEDEALIAMDMEEALSNAGYQVVGIADTEAEAILAARHGEADLVLMDITLREGNGISAARALATMSQLKIIFVSGNTDPKTLAAANALRPAGFIRKPFVGQELPRLVAALLREASA